MRKKRNENKNNENKNNENENPYIKLLPSTGGRPAKTLTQDGWNLVATLSQYMATDEEIAVALSDDRESISVDVLTNAMNKETFTEYKTKGKCKGKTSLRSWQWANARNGNTTMQIFLGKNYLGQSDKVEAEVQDTTININVTPATPEDADIDE